MNHPQTIPINQATHVDKHAEKHTEKQDDKKYSKQKIPKAIREQVWIQNSKLFGIQKICKRKR